MKMGILAAIALAAAACGGGSPNQAPIPTPIPPPSPTAPSPSPPPVATTTITIDATGRVTPADIEVARGTRVTFVNQHSSPHDMTSDPHPTHTNCPEVNSVGNLLPNQSRQTAPMNTVRRCGFHDHGEPDNGRLQGSITVR
jgi:plastocyanin